MATTTSDKKKIKVLFIQPTYAKYRRPLFERFLDNYNTTLFFVGIPPEIIQDRYFISYSGFDKTRSKHDPQDTGFRSAFYLLHQYLRLIVLLISNSYDVILTSISLSPQTMISLVVSKIKGKKCVLWIEEWLQSKSKFFVSAIPFLDVNYFLKKQVFRNVDGVVVEGTAQWNYAKSFGVPNDKLFFSNHCGLDYSLVGHTNLRQKLNIGNNLVILNVGQIEKRKGLDILIKAFSRIELERKDTYLVLCGDGSFRPFCESFAKKLKLEHVFFLGNVQEDELASYYRLADVFVLPSCVRPFGEGWGLVINEAMSVGLPIITTDAVGAAEDLVNGDNGYVVKNGDVTELYLALRRILNDELLRKTMGKNSQKLFKEFNDFDKMFEGFKRAIEHSVMSYDLT
jgi:glycosyltransferase involved in cell wall biosynthesis